MTTATPQTTPQIDWVPSAQTLQQQYERLQPKLQASAFNAPIYVEASDRDGEMRGEVYGVLPHSFDHSVPMNPSRLLRPRGARPTISLEVLPPNVARPWA